MNSSGMLYSKYLVPIYFLLITTTSHAASGGVPGAPAPITPAICEDALLITPTEMDFGSYVDGSGTIIMDTAGNMMHIGVIPVGSTIGVPASFNVTTTTPQCKNRAVTFTMPGSITMTNGGVTVSITNLVNDIPGPTFTVGKGFIINMGGTLTATAGDTKGVYTGPVDVILTYEPF